MKVIEVNNKKLKKEFINVASYIYKDDKYWVRPLDIDIQNGELHVVMGPNGSEKVH